MSGVKKKRTKQEKREKAYKDRQAKSLYKKEHMAHTGRNSIRTSSVHDSAGGFKYSSNKYQIRDYND